MQRFMVAAFVVAAQPAAAHMTQFLPNSPAMRAAGTTCYNNSPLLPAPYSILLADPSRKDAEGQDSTRSVSAVLSALGKLSRHKSIETWPP